MNGAPSRHPCSSRVARISSRLRTSTHSPAFRFSFDCELEVFIYLVSMLAIAVRRRRLNSWPISMAFSTVARGLSTAMQDFAKANFIIRARLNWMPSLARLLLVKIPVLAVQPSQHSADKGFVVQTHAALHARRIFFIGQEIPAVSY